VRRMGVALARRSLANLAATVHPLMWDVVIAEDSEGYRVTSKFRFHFEGHDGHAVIFDFGRWPLGYRTLRMMSGRTLQAWKGCLALPLSAGEREGSDELIFDFDWPRGINRLGSILSFPASLPKVIQSRASADVLPLATIRAHTTSGISTLSFLHPYDAGDLGSLPAGLVLNILPKSELIERDPSGACESIVTRSLGNKLTNTRLRALSLDVMTSASRSAEILKVPPPRRVVVADETALVHNRGGELPGVILLTEADIGEKPESFPMYYELARQLGALWWGGIVAAEGRLSGDVLEAISAALGLKVALSLSGDRERFALVKRRLLMRSQRSSLLDAWDSLNGRSRNGVISRLILALLAQEDFPQDLNTLLSESWGKAVNTSKILSAARVH